MKSSYPCPCCGRLRPYTHTIEEARSLCRSLNLWGSTALVFKHFWTNPRRAYTRAQLLEVGCIKTHTNFTHYMKRNQKHFLRCGWTLKSEKVPTAGRYRQYSLVPLEKDQMNG